MSTNVVDLIMQDHRELESMFESLMNEPEKRPGLVPVMITLLTAHSRAEEAEVYPAASESGGEEDVEHSQKEHLEADQLAAELAATDPASAAFPEALKALVDAVTHHVEEEETTVLPGMRERLDSSRLEELGQAFLASRQEHLGEQPADITKQELDQQARNLDMSGASGMSKTELKSSLESQAEQ
jgi:hemerythrin superfamily protein